ncbi:hypothetical protein JXA34_03640 [Patescibacteria group bacterium]|nr:hypothetical protein [Patescibacteria group bacterium]
MATILISTGLLILSQNTNAKDKCKDIDNKEEQIKCYEEKEEETKKKLASTREKIESTQKTIQDLSNQLNVTQSELQDVQNSIDEIINELELIKENLEDTREKLADKIDFRNNIIRNYSKRSIFNDIELFLPSENNQNLNGFQASIWLHAFNKKLNDESLKVIGILNSEVTQYETDKADTEELKEELENTQASLISLQNDLAYKKTNEEKEAEELEEKENGYEEELEELQDKILSIKASMENGTVGDYEKVSAKTPEPPFKPAFGAFSYGAYTHYKGMSQYGAKGRAKDGKDYEDIIEFYYKAGIKKKDDFPSEICVQGYGNMDFQKYLYGIAEMPSDWPEDALKAQAIAARSYAYRYYKNGTCICTTQSCQVFLKSKSDNPPSKWKEAVDDTKKKIIDGDVVAYYSSTTGGYIENVGWDVNGNWPGDAYEKKADSPWFYKAWYTKSYNDSSTCDHDHPWLTETEMADILNSWVVYTKGSSNEKSHISPLSDCWGGDPYSPDEMAEKADKYGYKYTSVSNVDIEISNNGYTSEVIFETNEGTVRINGDTFKTVFNLRAPGYVSIRSRLYDLERRD